MNKTFIEFIEIEKSEIKSNKYRMYDLEVEEDESYTANNIIVHNSSCRTRFVTGCGRPQFSAIEECVKVAKKYKKYIIADGGFKYEGDFGKALGIGADICMSGSFYAGTLEAEGEIIEEFGQKSKVYYGMSSKTANDKFFNGLKNYRTSEGEECLKVDYVGTVEDVNNKIFGGLRSMMTYIGAKTIDEIQKKIKFYKVNRQK